MDVMTFRALLRDVTSLYIQCSGQQRGGWGVDMAHVLEIETIDRPFWLWILVFSLSCFSFWIEYHEEKWKCVQRCCVMGIINIHYPVSGGMAGTQKGSLREYSQIRTLMHIQPVREQRFLKLIWKTSSEKIFKSCWIDLNFYSNKLLVFFAISHPACQAYEGRIYFLFQAVLLSRWAGCHGRTWLCFQVIWGEGSKAEAKIITSRHFVIVKSALSSYPSFVPKFTFRSALWKFGVFSYCYIWLKAS